MRDLSGYIILSLIGRNNLLVINVWMNEEKEERCRSDFCGWNLSLICGKRVVVIKLILPIVEVVKLMNL